MKKKLTIVFGIVVLLPHIIAEHFRCRKFYGDEETAEDEIIEKTKYGNYSLRVTNSGPAVIYSSISFLAELFPFTSFPHQESLFKYIWHNDANEDIQEQNNNWTSNITACNFYREIVPNKYRMTVCVYKNVATQRGRVRMVNIASGFTKFEITGKLNAKVNLQQNTSLPREHNYFATGVKVTYSVNLTDTFPASQPSLHYTWSACGKTYINQTMLVFSEPLPKVCRVTCDVKAIFDYKVNNLDKRKLEVGNHERDFVAATTELDGFWKNKIFFQDEIRNIKFTLLDDEITASKPFTVNVTYIGSNTSFCWRLIGNSSDPYINDTCTYSTSTWHLLKLTLHKEGVYRLEVRVSNNVSEVSQLSGELHVDEPVQPAVRTSTSQAIPIIISVVGILVIFVFAVHVLRVNKKKEVEVANFDFHPTLHERLTIRDKLSKYWNTTKGVLSPRNKYNRDHTHPKHRSSTARNYGATEESDNILL